MITYQITLRERKQKNAIMTEIRACALPTTITAEGLKGIPARFYKLLEERGARQHYIIVKQHAAAETLNVSKQSISSAARSMIACNILDFWPVKHDGRLVYAYKIRNGDYSAAEEYLTEIFLENGDITPLEVHENVN